MDKQTLEITIRFTEFKRLRNPFITITGVLAISDSSISLLFKNLQDLLFEILHTNNMFLS
jgi:hypothetical protein